MATAEVPSIFFFSSSEPHPKYGEVVAAAIAAGFESLSASGSGEYVEKITVTPPGGNPWIIAPGPHQSGLRLDTTTGFHFSLTNAP